MVQIPGYNLYAVQKHEIENALLDPTSIELVWYPNELGGWYLCSKNIGGTGITLVAGPYRDEQTALFCGGMMTDTSGT